MDIRLKACDSKYSQYVTPLLEQVRLHCEANVVRSLLQKWDGTVLTYLTLS